MTDDTRDRAHRSPEECEHVRGMYVYYDEETGQWVAYRNHEPISFRGDTKGEAIENCKEAIELFFEDETWYWDDWVMNCPACGSGLAPLRYAVFDPEDHRVFCNTCETAYRLGLRRVGDM